jgi:hypothetical protein
MTWNAGGTAIVISTTIADRLRHRCDMAIGG